MSNGSAQESLFQIPDWEFPIRISMLVLQPDLPGAHSHESGSHSSVWWTGSFDLRRRPRSTVAQGSGVGAGPCLLAESSGCVGAQGPAGSEAAAHSRQ